MMPPVSRARACPAARHGSAASARGRAAGASAPGGPGAVVARRARRAEAGVVDQQPGEDSARDPLGHPADVRRPGRDRPTSGSTRTPWRAPSSSASAREPLAVAGHHDEVVPPLRRAAAELPADAGRARPSRARCLGPSALESALERRLAARARPAWRGVAEPAEPPRRLGQDLLGLAEDEPDQRAPAAARG